MKEIKQFGLIGRNIDYSFSRNYFTDKFNSIEKLSNCEYINFDIESIEEVNFIFSRKNLFGSADKIKRWKVTTRARRLGIR